MTRKTTIQLLLINESDNEGEHVISLFRNAGRVARGHRANSAEDLHTMLEKDTWDLLIANDKHPEIAVEQCLEQLKKLHLEIPSIAIRDDGVAAAFQAGASDVVGIDDDERLIYASLRELEHLEKRRKLTKVEEKLRETEQRCEQLLSQSRDAIAYITDGMIINSNQLFSARFGFADPEELDCLPIIDLIDESDQEAFKGLLKVQQSNGEEDTHFAFKGLRHDGKNFSASMQLCNAVYDDEQCIQISVRDQTSGDSLGVNGSPDINPDTGLYSRSHFLEKLDLSNKQAVAATNISTLLYIGIDNYDSIRSRIGITRSDRVFVDIAAFIQEKSTEENCLTHYCDDSFTMIMPETGAEKAKKFAQSLCDNIQDHIIEIDEQSLQCTFSIGLTVLDNQQQVTTSRIIDNAFAACEQVREIAHNEGIGNGVSVYIQVREKISLADTQNTGDIDSFLEEALDDNRFSLSFQPIVSLRGTIGDHYEVQALITDDSDQEVSASEFLRSISFSKTNTRLDRWIILEATKLLAGKLEQDRDTRLFINLTSQALQDKTLITWLNVALKAGGIPPDAIIFQFEESNIVDYLKPAIVFSETIKAIGCKLSIANFGRSNDPLRTLRNVNADFAKLAGDFTKELEGENSTQTLKTMVGDILEQNSQAIISDVENAAALAMLWQIGVDYIQGGYLASPTKSMHYEFTDIA
ncbi:MAG: diguanylate cyclase (GGDEF)-like protein/PAS domain S-box-containing protein [Oceanicoccus sp.]|jgi:diguanylate cyclase (GGDEF)-like protein/PAS domain S-box-containing protein